jgi:PKD repeat protein
LAKLSHCGGVQGVVNTPITFDSTGSRDPDGWKVEYLWIFGDNSVGQTEAFPVHTFSSPGEYNVSLVVHDNFQVLKLSLVCTSLCECL